MRKSLFADLILLLVTVVWGTSFIIVQNAINILPPHSYNFVRFFFATIVLFILIIIFDRNCLKQITKQTIIAGIVLGILLFLGFALQTVGLLYTSAAKAGFITGLNVLLVPIFSIIIIKIRPKLSTLIGVIVAAVGLYIMTMLGSTTEFSIGDFLVFLCAIFFALQIVYTGKYAPKHSAFALALIQVFVVAILSFISALIFEDISIITNPNIILASDVIYALIITAIFGTALAYLAQQYLQKFTSPTRVALIFTMEPVFAALTTIIVEQQMLSLYVSIGGLLIFLGMILSEIPSKKLTIKKEAVISTSNK